MKRKARVLIVDDSVVVRRLVTEALASDPDCEVVGAVSNGRIALARIPLLEPTVVTLDVEMPEMDGLETLTEIRKLYPRLPVIMFSALTERAADATLRALSLGASDYVTKPSGAGREAAVAQVREQLLPKVRTLGCSTSGEVERSEIPARPGNPPTAGRRAGPAARVDVLAIGCSTGGPNALAALLGGLPTNIAVPVVIVQHMPAVFTRMLADRLRAQTGHAIQEAQGGEALEPGLLYVAPGDHHMFVARDGAKRRVQLNQDARENSCRPAVDVLFRSVANTYGASCLAVVMTGMGQDGLLGCRRVREVSGQIIVQDAATSVVWGMPGAVATEGLADAILPLSEIASEIARRIPAAVATKTPVQAAANRGASCP